MDTLPVQQLAEARRIVVVGSPGAGKSTLTVQLGKLLDRPVIHLDQLWWRPGWIEAGQEAFDDRLRSIVQTDDWIIDGNYSRTLDIRLARADAAIMLDLPRTLCLYRSLKRAHVYRGQVRPDMAPGCPEKVDWEFLRFVWSYPRRSRERVVSRLTRFAQRGVLIQIRCTSEVAALLRRVAAVGPSRK